MLISLHIVKAMSAIFCLVSRIPQFLGTLSKVPVKEDFAFANTAAVQRKNRYQDKIPCEAHACGTWYTHTCRLVYKAVSHAYKLAYIIVFRAS